MHSSPELTNVERLVKGLMRQLASKDGNLQITKMPLEMIDKLDRKLQIASSVLRGHRNSRQGINRLPPELLFMIFQNIQEHLPSFLPFPSNRAWGKEGLGWFSLIHVCRHWRGVFASFPSLWATIDNRLVPELCLKRSKGANLDVFLNVKGADMTFFDAGLMEALKPHMSRFREFHIDTSGWQGLQPVYSLLSVPAPELTSLSIMTDGHDVTGGVLPSIFGDTMPSLRQVALSHFTSWPTDYFKNLTHFCLYDQLDVALTSRPSTKEFLDFLECSPMLRQLVLVRSGPTRQDADDFPPPAPGRRVELKHLTELSIGDWFHSAPISRFLQHLSLPKKAGLYIWGRTLFSNFEPPLQFLPQDITHLKNFEDLQELWLIRQPLGDYVDIQFLVAQRTLCIVGPFTADDVEVLMARCNFKQVHSLMARDAYEHPIRLKTVVWRGVYDHLPLLKHLRIFAASHSIMSRAILTPLRAVEPEGDGEGGRKQAKKPDILCPLWESLCIEHDPNPPALHIIDIAEGRAKQGCPLAKFMLVRYDPYLNPTTAENESIVSADVDKDFQTFSEDYFRILRKYITEVVDDSNKAFLSRITPALWPTDSFVWATYSYPPGSEP